MPSPAAHLLCETSTNCDETMEPLDLYPPGGGAWLARGPLGA